mmetsp:Transcript_31386/g.66849  ORF Transcript_31386/g.66849 Transcript_31386/m.66849 type:complete len:420 (+) Transcript_31386:212-1471(+)
MFRRKARNDAFDEEDGSTSKSKNKLKRTDHQSNPRLTVSINLLVALFAFLLALLLLRQDSCSPGKEIGPQLQALPAVSFGPLTAADLPPDENFIKSTQYTDMLKYVRERNDIEGLRHSFEEKGYIIFKPEIPEDVLEGAKKFTEDVYNTCIVNLEPPEKCRNMHQDKFMEVEAVRKLAQNYHIRAMMAVLNGYNPYPIQTLNYPCTSLARTHSDYIHFAAHPLPLMNAAWVALIDVQPDAGPVFYHEGSHKLPFYNMQDFGLNHRGEGMYNYAKYQNFMTEAMSLHGRYYEAVIPKGHCLIWSANLVHGGPPSATEKKPRFSQVTHYFFHGSNYNWVPVASNLHKRKVEYYATESVLEMWDEKIPLAKRKSLSKFVEGDCEKFTKRRDDVISPCEMQSRPPLIMSKLYEYVQQEGEVVM